MNGFLSVITSDVAILIYLLVAITVSFFFVIKFIKKNKDYKKKIEEDIAKEKEDKLFQSLYNDKRGS